MTRRPFLRRTLRPALLALIPLAIASQAEAQVQRATGNGSGFDTHLFRPAVDSKGFFSVNGADVLGANEISFGLVSDYGHELMRLAPNHGSDALITHSFQGTFGFNYGLFNRLVVGIQLPINLMAGDGVTQIGTNAAPYDSDKLDQQGLGFLALHAKLKLLRNEQALGIAVLVQGAVPTQASNALDLAADPKPWVWPHLVLEKQIGGSAPGAVHLGIDGGYRIGGTGDTTTFEQLSAGKFTTSSGLITGGAGASVRLLEQVDLVAETYLSKQAGGSSSSAVSLSQEVVGGFKIFVERNSYLMLGGGVRVDKGFEAADQRAFVGLIFEPSIGDRDGDGFKDDEDDCPDEPEDFDGFQDTREDSPPGKLGCPDPDNDNDGIPDKRDACPNVPEDMDGDADDDGCPEVDTRDRDHDGILDKDDKCPDDPEDKDGFEDTDGCPDPDNDKDGIPDRIDNCPNEPEDKDGFEDEDGCPDPDNDKDRIPDVVDKCPNEPETYNGFQDEDGCPDKGSVIIQDNNIMILEKIQFETGSARIRKESNGILDAVSATLKGHPEFELLEVQGHADRRGDEKMNLRLTKDRANSVVEALVSRGLDRSRLRSQGYGEYCPLDPAETPKAFDKNRRVEFKVVVTSGEPTGVELGCDDAKKHGVEPAPVPAKK